VHLGLLNDDVGPKILQRDALKSILKYSAGRSDVEER
jgi:hypothetical protein